MNTNLPDDNDLRSLFGELRRRDDAAVTEFDQLRQAKLAGSSVWSQIRYTRVALALIIALLIGGGSLLLLHADSGKPLALRSATNKIDEPSLLPEPAASLDTWQSPTAFLLRSSEDWDATGAPQADPAGLAPATQPNSRRSTS